MAQTNVIVSYTPVRRGVADRRPADQNERRWNAALAGALLAGAAVFTLGHFIAADGEPRETRFRARPISPLLKAEPAETLPMVARMGQPRTLVTQSERLPYLAFVRDVPPAPPAGPAIRTMVPPPIVRASTHRPRRVELVAAAIEPVAVVTPVAAAAPVIPETPALAVDLAAPPTPPPAASLRRDLEGFLQTQGHELAFADKPATLVVAEPQLVEGPAALAEMAVVAPVEAGFGDATDAPILAAAQPDPRLDPAAAPLTVANSPPIAPIRTENAPPSRLAIAQAPAIAANAAAPSPVTIQSYPLAVVDGEAVGAITLRNAAVGEPTVHLGTLVGLLRLKMPEAEYVRLSTAAAADRFVTLDELRAAGITVQFDPRANRLLIDAR